MRVQSLKAILSGTLLAVLFLPVVQMRLGLFDPTGVEDKRELASFSDLDLQSPDRLPFELDRYFGDHYGFRTFLIKVANSLRYYVLGVSPTEDVILGRDGWLFYASPTDGDIRYDYKKTNRYTDEQMEDIASVLLTRRELLKQLGAEYVLVFVPNKGSVYPEHLPPRYDKYKGQSRYDQLVTYLKKNTDLRIVDVKPALLTAKDGLDVPLYNQRGTHWNDVGAFIAYREIAAELKGLFLGIEPAALKDHDMGELSRVQGLQRTLGVFNSQPTREATLGSLKEKASFTATEDRGIYHHKKEVREVVVCGDSFFEKLKRHLASHIREIHWESRQSFNMAAVIDRRPPLVIHESVERYLDRLADDNAHYNLGTSLMYFQRYREALREYSRALELNPDIADAYVGAGLASMNLKDHERAVASFRKSLRIVPDNTRAHFHLGRAYRAMGAYKDALEEFSLVLSYEPANIEAYSQVVELQTLLK